MCHLNLKRWRACDIASWQCYIQQHALASFARFVFIFIIRASLISLNIGQFKLLDVATLAVEVQVHQTCWSSPWWALIRNLELAYSRHYWVYRQTDYSCCRFAAVLNSCWKPSCSQTGFYVPGDSDAGQALLNRLFECMSYSIDCMLAKQCCAVQRMCSVLMFLEGSMQQHQWLLYLHEMVMYPCW